MLPDQSRSLCPILRTSCAPEPAAEGASKRNVCACGYLLTHTSIDKTTWLPRQVAPFHLLESLEASGLSQWWGGSVYSWGTSRYYVLTRGIYSCACLLEQTGPIGIAGDHKKRNKRMEPQINSRSLSLAAAGSTVVSPFIVSPLQPPRASTRLQKPELARSSLHGSEDGWLWGSSSSTAVRSALAGCAGAGAGARDCRRRRRRLRRLRAAVPRSETRAEGGGG
ncbi:hypothetical protein GGR56DRAFT_546783 [Xylariaceae sp. FL0804]|nr:hypothetical protein GGR56DRAFT_546783 [Xylariaceae sp. FL0804]